MKRKSLVVCSKAEGACMPCTHAEPHQHLGNEDCGPGPCLYMFHNKVSCKAAKGVKT